MYCSHPPRPRKCLRESWRVTVPNKHATQRKARTWWGSQANLMAIVKVALKASQKWLRFMALPHHYHSESQAFSSIETRSRSNRNTSEKQERSRRRIRYSWIWKRHNMTWDKLCTNWEASALQLIQWANMNKRWTQFKALKLIFARHDTYIRNWTGLTSSLRPVVTGYLFFSVSSPKRRMYVLYQQAIIWVLPVYFTTEKKVEKKVSPPISPFSEHKTLNLFFSPFLSFFISLWIPVVCRMLLMEFSGLAPKNYHCLSSSFRWHFVNTMDSPPSMLSRLSPSYPRVIRPFPHHNCH